MGLPHLAAGMGWNISDGSLSYLDLGGDGWYSHSLSSSVARCFIWFLRALKKKKKKEKKEKIHESRNF
jgi:hypothetical protein